MTKPPILLAVLLCACAANAQVAKDRQELRQDARQTRDDWRDAARLESLIARFDAARGRGDTRGLAAVEAELSRLLANELTESRRELSQDQRELGSDRRELRRDIANGRRAGVRADDVRDLRDDRRDARAEAVHGARVLQIDSELRGLSGRADGPSLDRKRELMGELVVLARQEVRQDARESGEDRRELREDRRQR
ncbi:MAG: hypothetical protein JNK82_18565 [Myxococcaceae bacterium]|nr:hypothetical protein [Myxococcaceae bacterium]